MSLFRIAPKLNFALWRFVVNLGAILDITWGKSK